MLHLPKSVSWPELTFYLHSKIWTEFTKVSVLTPDDLLITQCDMYYVVTWRYQANCVTLSGHASLDCPSVQLEGHFPPIIRVS